MKIPDNAHLIAGVIFQGNEEKMLLLFAITVNNILLYQINGGNAQTTAHAEGIISNHCKLPTKVCQSYT